MPVVCAQRRKRGHLPISNQSVIDLGESKNSGGLAAIPLGRSETNGYDHCKTPRDPGENGDLRHFFSDHQPLRYIYNLDGYVFLLRVLVFFPGIQNHTHPITNKKKLFKKNHRFAGPTVPVEATTPNKEIEELSRKLEELKTLLENQKIAADNLARKVDHDIPAMYNSLSERLRKLESSKEPSPKTDSIKLSMMTPPTRRRCADLKTETVTLKKPKPDLDPVVAPPPPSVPTTQEAPITPPPPHPVPSEKQEHEVVESEEGNAEIILKLVKQYLVKLGHAIYVEGSEDITLTSGAQDTLPQSAYFDASREYEPPDIFFILCHAVGLANDNLEFLTKEELLEKFGPL
jgi:hypothetical protein